LVGSGNIFKGTKIIENTTIYWHSNNFLKAIRYILSMQSHHAIIKKSVFQKKIKKNKNYKSQTV